MFTIDSPLVALTKALVFGLVILLGAFLWFSRATFLAIVWSARK
jgi:hypothetical protein